MVERCSQGALRTLHAPLLRTHISASVSATRAVCMRLTADARAFSGGGDVMVHMAEKTRQLSACRSFVPLRVFSTCGTSSGTSVCV